jgi:DNA repair protein RadA/Sms
MPTKALPQFFCTKCDAQFLKWSGRCEECGGWGSIKEIASGDGPKPAAGADAPRAGRAAVTKAAKTPIAFSDARAVAAPSAPTGYAPLDQVLGGGFVEGAVTLVAGEPGVGKSTLLAQVALSVATSGRTAVYVTGEESPAQVRRRFERLSPVLPPSLLFLDDVDAETIAATIAAAKPHLAIVDSVQTIRTDAANGEAGSVSQVKASSAFIAEAAKSSRVPVVLVGQVTKDGDIAGPRVLEHLVDTVLFLEGDHQHRYRLLRPIKHRFGATDETALLTMTGNGLSPVDDPSQELLRDRLANAAGSAIGCVLEGHRPMLIELQALVSPAGYGTPVRRATGIDAARLGILLAVLAKRASAYALDKDVYANAAGGLDAREPAADLALCAAIASAVKDKPLDARIGFFGEVGLAGEIRPVGLPELRAKEFGRLGFTRVVVPPRQSKNAPKGVELIEARTLREALGAGGL